MNRRPLWLLSFSLIAAGCTCGAFDPNVTRFACAADADCGPGYVCSVAGDAKECVRLDATGGGGGTGGGVGTGGGSAGGGGAATGGGGVTGGGMGGGSATGGGSTGGGDAGTDAGTDAGSDAGADAGTDAGVDGGADAGIDAGFVPDHLVFTTSPQTVALGACSQAVTIQVRDSLDRPINVPANQGLALSAAPLSLLFYSAAGCGGVSQSNAVILAGTNSITAFFHSFLPSAGTTVLTVTPSFSPRLMPITQTETLTTPPNSLVFITSAPAAPTSPGTCFLATVEARVGNAAVPVGADSLVSLVSTPVDGLRFFSNATCTGSTISSTTIPSGQARASFYVKTITGGVDGISASTGFGTAQLSLTVGSVARRGTCSLSSGVTTFTCPISPPQTSMAKTMVVYQATASSSTPDEYEVRCRLTAIDGLTCERTGTGSQVNVSWQTAELVTGLQVQRSFAPNCFTRVIPLAPVVDPASSFVLSSLAGNGTNYDGDDLSAMRLTPDGGSVFLDNRDFAGVGCTGYEMQVVQLSGVSSLRGSSGTLMLGQRQLTQTGLPAASTNAVLLNQAVMSANPTLSLSMCNFLVRAEMTSPTSLLFSRGADQPNPASCAGVNVDSVHWERVDFGTRARVQAFTVNLQNNSVDLTIASVDTTRTLVFAGGQMSGGQSTGETAVDNTNDDSIGQAQARFDLTSATTVRVTRGRSQSTGIVTFYVVELEP